MAKNRLPLKWALLWIFLSVVIVSGGTAGGVIYWRYWRAQVRADPAHYVRRLIHPGTLPTSYLAELIGLSHDRPISLYDISPEALSTSLLESPFIQSAEVSRLKPDGLRIDYTVPKPIARLPDRVNTGVDAKGNLFPLLPYLQAHGLPELIVGSVDEVDLGLKLLAALDGVTCIDTSRIDAPSSGLREIVVEVETPCQALLRLPVTNWEEAIQRYQLLLKQDLIADQAPLVIDLRLHDLAYLHPSPVDQWPAR